MNARPAEAIVIGASAGALDALSALLPGLPADYPLPILIVVHLHPDRRNMLVELLQAKCEIRISEAEDKAPIQPGVAYLAPPDYHLLVELDKTMSLSSEERVHFSRPAIDVLFETAADAYDKALIGVILTGANDDGAAGLRKIVAAGGVALVQSPQGAYAREMPEFAIKACPSAQVMTLDDIALYMRQLSTGKV